MTTLSGLWMPVFGTGPSHPNRLGSWNANRQRLYLETGANRMINAPVQSDVQHPIEDDILAWIQAGSGRPALGVFNRKDSRGRRLWNLAAANSTLARSTIQRSTREILRSYESDGFADAIWGYEVNHEDYGSNNASWQRLGWVVDTIASEQPDKVIIGVGATDAYKSDAFFAKLWSENNGLFVAERYVWRASWSVQKSVEEQEKEWRAIADKAIRIHTGNANKWMGIVACHEEVHRNTRAQPPADVVFYQYPSETELLYTAIGPIAHGAQGTLFFLFDSGWEPVDSRGIQRAYRGVSGRGVHVPTQRIFVKNAIARMDKIKRWLDGSTYQSCAHSDSLPASWSLVAVHGRDTADPLNILEVCYWTSMRGEDLYVLCNRDPDRTKHLMIRFNRTYTISHNGRVRHRGRFLRIRIGKGDAAVLKLVG